MIAWVSEAEPSWRRAQAPRLVVETSEPIAAEIVWLDPRSHQQINRDVPVGQLATEVVGAGPMPKDLSQCSWTAVPKVAAARSRS